MSGDGEKLVIQAEPVAVSLREGAALIGLGTNGLYTAIREGRGPRTFRVGNRHLVTIDALKAWAASLEEVNDDASS